MRFYIFLLFLTILQARENPFIPTDRSINMGFATNKESPIKEFEQKELTLPNSARILKEVSISFQNLDGTITTINSPIDKKVDWHHPLIITQKRGEETQTKSLPSPTKNEIKSYKITDFFSVDIAKNELILHSKDALIRHFMVANPFKIVIDFKAEKNFYTKHQEVNFENIVKFSLGNHDSYYRAVIELDGQYTYKLDNSTKDKISISLY